MKITKTQLKQIIKEELDNALNEEQLAEGAFDWMKKLWSDIKADAYIFDKGAEFKRRVAANPNYGLSRGQIADRKAAKGKEDLINQAHRWAKDSTVTGSGKAQAIRVLKNLQIIRRREPEDEKVQRAITHLASALGRQHSSAALEENKSLEQLVREELEAALNEEYVPAAEAGYVPSSIDPSSTSWFNGPLARLNERQIADLFEGSWGKEKMSVWALALAEWDIHPDLHSALWQSGLGKYLTRAQEFKLEDWSAGQFAPGDKEAIGAARMKLLPAALEMLDSGAHHRQEPGMGRY